MVCSAEAHIVECRGSVGKAHFVQVVVIIIIGITDVVGVVVEVDTAPVP